MYINGSVVSMWQVLDNESKCCLVETAGVMHWFSLLALEYKRNQPLWSLQVQAVPCIGVTGRESVSVGLMRPLLVLARTLFPLGEP